MTTHRSEGGGDESASNPTGTERVRDRIASVRRVDGKTVGLLLGGGIVAVRGLVSSKSRLRTLGHVLVAGCLVYLGIRQFRRTETMDAAETSDEAHAARQQYGPEAGADDNPRDITDDAETAAETERDSGDIQFDADQDLDGGAQPDLEDEAGVEDPRRRHDDEVEIDLSEAAVADEASEAAGPSSAQAQPAMTEDTEPDHSPAEDASHVEADTPGGGDDDAGPNPDAETGAATDAADAADPENVVDDIVEGDADDEDREAVETEGGAEIHTDTMESGEIDIDEEDVSDPDSDEDAATSSDDPSAASDTVPDSEDDQNDKNRDSE